LAKADDRVDAVARKTRASGGNEYVGSLVTASDFVVIKADTSLNWAGAKAACAKQGGVLASLTSLADINALKKYIKEGTWVGAKNDAKTTTTWKWLTGEPIPQNFPGWAPGNPNGDEDCLSLETDGLHDYGCTATKRNYVCQHSRA